MGKIFGILLMVIGIWAGITVYTEGVDAAFGGLFAGARREAADASGRPLTRRSGEAVGKAFQAYDDQTEKRTAD